MREAEKNGVLIQQLETNGEVRKEFVLLGAEDYKALMTGIIELTTAVKDLK